MVGKMTKLSILFLLLWNYVEIDGNCRFFENKNFNPKIRIQCSEFPWTTMLQQLEIVLYQNYVGSSQIALNFRNHSFENQNETLRKNWLTVNVNLRTLTFSDIEIHEIEDDAFNESKYEWLHQLEFREVPIRHLRSGTFNGLNNLEILRFKGMELVSFTRNVFATVPQMKRLDIDGCGSNKLELDNLFGSNPMPKLFNLLISHCNLNDTITETTFQSLYGIGFLSLGQNSIEYIGERSFDVVLQTLQRLYMRWNRIKSLDGNLFKTNRNIDILVNSNFWHCDCGLESLRHLIKTAKNLIFDQINCLTPSKYMGLSLGNFTTFCPEPSLYVPPDNSASVSDEITFMDDPILIENETETVITPANNQTEEGIVLTEIEQTIISCDHQTEKTTSQIEKELTSTKPLPASTSMIAVKNEQLIINDRSSSKERYIIGFEEELFEGGYKDTTKCFTKSNESKKINVEKDLKSNRIYRFCTMKKGSTTITPLHCVSFVSIIEPKIELINVDALIMMKDKTMSITKFVINSIFVFLISVLGSILMANCFQEKFQAMRLPENGNKA